MINNVVLVGRLTKDVELRYTPSQSQPTNSNSGGNQPSQTQSSPATPDFGRDSDPFSGGTPMNLSDDDLPF